MEELAGIYVKVKEYDATKDLIEYLLSIPVGLSIPLLRIDPKWDPLRDRPWFRQLMEDHND